MPADVATLDLLLKEQAIARILAAEAREAERRRIREIIEAYEKRRSA